jgi:FkbM family methyltransferase
MIRWRYPFSEFNSDFEAPVMRAFRDLTSPGALVLDVGASFGLYSVFAARLVGDGGRVFAFEPSSVADVLTDHLRLNGVADRVEVLRMIVGDDAGEAELWESTDSMFASVSRAAAERGASPNGKTQRHLRPMTTLDAFCASRQIAPDVVKIDVEGAEGRVLRGASDFLAKGRGHIFLEVHPSVLMDLGETPDELSAYLERRGWGMTHIYQRGDATDPAATLHYLCAPLGRP